jgi:hypothetical protein
MARRVARRPVVDAVGAAHTGSPRFAELWASGAVGAYREDHKIVKHPAVGPIAVDCDVLTDGDAERKIVVLTPAPDTEDQLPAGGRVRRLRPCLWLSRTGRYVPGQILG